jgi:biotin carboxylase
MWQTSDSEGDQTATMPAKKPMTILCVASYEKGKSFIQECKRQDCTTLLLTSASLREADWPRESLDEIFFIPDKEHHWHMPDVLSAVSYLNRRVPIDRIVALDDFDVEKVAALREHLRVPGMGETTARYFRDKLAMRMKASESGIPVPAFVGILHYPAIEAFMNENMPPYVLKPRTQASAIGIKKVLAPGQLWEEIDRLGDLQSHYLLEKFVPGNVYHVDSLISEKKPVFALSSAYGKPPFEVMHSGRVFTTATLPPDSPDTSELLQLNEMVLREFGYVRGASHTEFIRGDDGKYYFLETSARVGGAHIAEMVEAATGVNLWSEWAKIESQRDQGSYQVAEVSAQAAGLLVSLAKQENPDTSAYSDPEIVWRMNKTQHVGLIVRSPSYERVQELLREYTERFYQDFFATAPPPERA